MVLDTSVIIAHFRDDATVTGRLASEDFLCVPAVAVGELYYGAYRASNSEEARERIRSFLDVTHTLVVDEETADQYGVIKKALAEKGTPIPDNDIWVAASAMRHGMPLAARDQHFTLINGLDLRAW